MRALILSAFAAIAFSGSVNAATFQTAAVATPAATLESDLTAICTGEWVLSEKATAACKSQEFPRLRKDGMAFVNTGVGAEFNTLLRQIKR